MPATDLPILLMDEPFLVADPVVRHELRNAVLLLQSEFRKTIVFVTYGIDEALELANKVSVFGRRGVSGSWTNLLGCCRGRLMNSWRSLSDSAVAIGDCNSSTRPCGHCTASSESLRTASPILGAPYFGPAGC